MTNEKIITKIEKLLALAGNNPSEQKDQAAMLKAQKLMAEHNLNMAQFQDKPQEDLDPSLYQGVLKVLKSNYKRGGR